MSIIKADKLNYDYLEYGEDGEKPEITHAVRDVNLKIKEGQFIAILGHNGSGKSTLLNAIAGVWPVDSGSISIDGQDVTGLPDYRRAKLIGRVFQDPMTGTAATMQIDENLALAKRRGRRRGLRWGVTQAERGEYRERLKLLNLGLEDRMTSKVGLLSGGQRQALTLLMATLQKPKLLLLDEHTAALDPKTAEKVLNATERIIDEDHLTALMITHNMRDAIAHGNRLIMMHEGHIIFDVSGEDKKMLLAGFLFNPFSELRSEAPYRYGRGFVFARSCRSMERGNRLYSDKKHSLR